jgi:hypothetical protein
MDPALYPPELVEAHAAERSYLLAGGLPLPSPTRLCEAGRLVGARAVVAVAPVDGARDELGLDVYDPHTCRRRVVTMALRDDPAEARRVATAIVDPRAAFDSRIVVPPVAPPAEPPPALATTPWYGRWYTIAGAGAVVVGGVVLGLLLGGGDDSVHAASSDEAVGIE